MWLEILWAIIVNLKITAQIMLIIYGTVATIAVAIGLLDHSAEEIWTYIKQLYVIPIFLVLTIFTNIPSPDKIIKVRIALIKLQLTSPKNVGKAAAVIERLGKKLECKYLGGCKDSGSDKAD